MVKLADFGVATKLADLNEQVSETEPVPVGTPYWMAPEVRVRFPAKVAITFYRLRHVWRPVGHRDDQRDGGVRHLERGLPHH